MFGKRQELVSVCSVEEQVRVQEALAAAGIASAVKVRGAARTIERRARMGGSPARGEVSYILYVQRDEYERAAGVLHSLRSGG